MKKKDGGPAFPNPETGEKGASLRDVFAMQALVLMARPDYHLFRDSGETLTAEQVASNAYLIADAMLVEREKP